MESPKTESPITKLSIKMDKEFEVANDLHKELRSRLDIVLSQEVTSEMKEEKLTATGSSQHFNNIDGWLYKVIGLNDNLRNLISSLEI